MLVKEGTTDATEKPKLKGARLISGAGGTAIKTSRIVKSFPAEVTSTPEADEEVQELVTGSRKRKQRPFKVRAPNNFSSEEHACFLFDILANAVTILTYFYCCRFTKMKIINILSSVNLKRFK